MLGAKPKKQKPKQPNEDETRKTGGVQGQVKGQWLMGIKAVNDSIGCFQP